MKTFQKRLQRVVSAVGVRAEASRRPSKPQLCRLILRSIWAQSLISCVTLSDFPFLFEPVFLCTKWWAKASFNSQSLGSWDSLKDAHMWWFKKASERAAHGPVGMLQPMQSIQVSGRRPSRWRFGNWEKLVSLRPVCNTLSGLNIIYSRNPFCSPLKVQSYHFEETLVLCTKALYFLSLE